MQSHHEITISIFTLVFSLQVKACCSRCDREFDTTAELDVHFGLFHAQQPAVPVNDAPSMVLPSITQDEKQKLEVYH